jgi:hypothetical protein
MRKSDRRLDKMDYIVPQKLVLVVLVLIVVAAFPTYGKEVSFQGPKHDLNVKQEDLHYGVQRRSSPPPPPKRNDETGQMGRARPLTSSFLFLLPVTWLPSLPPPLMPPPLNHLSSPSMPQPPSTKNSPLLPSLNGGLNLKHCSLVMISLTSSLVSKNVLPLMQRTLIP